MGFWDTLFPKTKDRAPSDQELSKLVTSYKALRESNRAMRLKKEALDRAKMQLDDETIA